MASHTTRDHAEIQNWAAEHDACPAVVSRTGGMLRFEFDPERASSLTQVDWDDFFQVFDEKGLELVYDDKPGSRFHKFVYPETVAAKAEHRPRSKPARAAKRMSIVPAQGQQAGGQSAGSRAGRTTRAKSAGPGARSRRSRVPAQGRRQTAVETAPRAKKTSRSASSRAGAKSRTSRRGKRAA